MKKMLLALFILLTMVGCNSVKEVKLESQTVNGVKLDIPEDMSSFEIQDDDTKLSSNEASTAFVQISDPMSADGLTAEAFTEADLDDFLEDRKDVKIRELDNKKIINDVSVVFAKVECTNSNDVEIEEYLYFPFYNDGTFQMIQILYSKDQDSSVEYNIDKICNSIELQQTETENNNQQVTFPLTIVNQTSVEIYELYCSTVNTDEWEEELLGSDTIIYPNDQFTINFTLNQTNDLIWDFKMVDIEGTSVDFYNVDFTGCSTSGELFTITVMDGQYYATLNGNTYEGQIEY